ncbi:hypothetical protein AGOR_G00009940 [Albula goreensis]|uniref:Transmembrane protein 144 n=1 Tax=Albula goreensis TaxID=1534307 RepID=A0A8T3E6D2_9TELE|nr:hypothetical protein AGOR_G00009940 [Albula goreensis]
MRTVITVTQVCAAALLLICSTAQAHGPSLSHLRPQEMAEVSEGLRPARPNATDPGGISKWSLMKGFTCLGVCVLGFGSSLVPIKNTVTGDGMFFQWVFCCTLWLGSFVAHSLLGCPRVWLLSVFGGSLWCLGNLSTVPILKTVGLGIGFLIWSMVSLLMGWATARFGWFGLDPQDVPSPTLNYIGTALATVSTLILFFVKTETEQGDREEKEPLLSRNLHRGRFNQLDCVVNEYILGESSNRSWVDRLSPTQKKSL